MCITLHYVFAYQDNERHEQITFKWAITVVLDSITNGR